MPAGLKPVPPDEDTKPQPWVCGECGYVDEPVWHPYINPRWVLPEGGRCPACIARSFAEASLALGRQRTIANYGLDEGEYAHMTFEDYQPKHSTQVKAKQAAMDLVEDWRQGAWHKGLMLVSPKYGVGKTHLVIAAARVGLGLYVPKGSERMLVIWDVPTLLGDIKNSYNNGGPADIVEPAMSSGILVLDDLGVEHYVSESWYQNVLYDIFNARWKGQLATLITTNLGPDSLRGRVGGRVWSRMVSLVGVPILMEGEDYRLK